MNRLLIFLLLILCLGEVNAQPEGDNLIPYRNGSKWGYSDTLGNTIISVKYDSVTFFQTIFNKSVAEVYLNKKTRFIDNSGKAVSSSKLARLKKKESNIFRMGTITNPQRVIIGLKVFENNNKKGIKYRMNDKVIVPAIYDSIILPKLLGDYDEREEKVFFLKKDNKWLVGSVEKGIYPNAIFDKIMNPSFLTVFIPATNPSVICILGIVNGKVNLYSSDTKTFILKGFDDIFPFKNNTIFYIKQMDKFGFADSNGKIIVQPKYQHIVWVRNNLYEVWLNGKRGYVSSSGIEYFKN